MASNRKKRKKQKPSLDGLGLVFKVIVISVVVFFIGYYAMFWVMRGIVNPFMETNQIEDDQGIGKETEIPKEVTPTPPTTREAPKVETTPLPVSPAVSEKPVTTQTLWRVYVGHYASKDDAVADLSVVRELAPGAFIVNPGDFRIQVAAFQNEEAAQQVAEDLRQQGWEAEVTSN